MALSQEQINALPQPLVSHFQKLEHNIVARVTKHIGSIGELTATDIRMLDELQRMGYNVAEIEREVAAAINNSEEAIHDIFMKAAQTEYETYDLTRGVPFAENERLQELVEQISKATFNEFVNIHRSTTIGLVGKDGKIRSVAKWYQQTLDYAILQVRTGQADFHSAMRSTLRTMAGEGLSFVEYESGYKRRVDSTVRMNLLGGMAQLSHAQAEMIGQTFGADGYEISYHSGFRPTHDFGGKQFTAKEYYDEILPLMQEPNCYHRSFPIIIGVSTPAYTKEQLQKLNKKELEEHVFEGKKYNRYNAEQKQRRYETAIRKQKDYINAFDSSGDEKALKTAKIKLRQLRKSYNDFSDAVKLSPKPKRVA